MCQRHLPTTMSSSYDYSALEYLRSHSEYELIHHKEIVKYVPCNCTEGGFTPCPNCMMGGGSIRDDTMISALLRDKNGGYHFVQLESAWVSYDYYDGQGIGTLRYEKNMSLDDAFDYSSSHNIEKTELKKGSKYPYSGEVLSMDKYFQTYDGTPIVDEYKLYIEKQDEIDADNYVAEDVAKPEIKMSKKEQKKAAKLQSMSDAKLKLKK